MVYDYSFTHRWHLAEWTQLNDLMVKGFPRTLPQWFNYRIGSTSLDFSLTPSLQQILILVHTYVTVFGKIDRLAREKFCFVTFYVEQRCHRPNLKPMVYFWVRRASFSLFPLASSYSNDYFREYAIIDFLANQLDSPNMLHISQNWSLESLVINLE